MKKTLFLMVLFCLGLAGCGSVSPREAQPTEPLPTPMTPTVIMTDPQPIPAADVPVLLETGEGETPMLRGPAGTVAPRFFLGAFVQDWAYGDVDRDGETELVYLCPGPTSGLFTEAVCVYGLEQGWPVLKACRLFCLNWGEARLEQDGSDVLFCLEPVSWHPGPSGAERETLRLPVTADNGHILLNGGELPEEITGWGGPGWDYYGASFADLSRRMGRKATIKHWSCLVWQEQLTMVQDSDPAGKNTTVTYAAVTDNSTTVTGLIRWEEQGDGSCFCIRDGIEPIQPMEDPEALVGLTAAELEARLGPCHFDLGSGLYIPCWFTEDGKLLTVQLFDSVAGAELRDLLAGEGQSAQSEDPDTVTVDQREIPTTVKNMARWERFLETTKRGEADAVTLHKIYEEGEYELSLSYDGNVYILIDEGKTWSFRHLIVSEDYDPPASALYRHAVFYLLSDDPGMTAARYLAHMVSSVWDPDFPNTRPAFTVYGS